MSCHFLMNRAERTRWKQKTQLKTGNWNGKCKIWMKMMAKLCLCVWHSWESWQKFCKCCHGLNELTSCSSMRHVWHVVVVAYVACAANWQAATCGNNKRANEWGGTDTAASVSLWFHIENAATENWQQLSGPQKRGTRSKKRGEERRSRRRKKSY